MSREEERNVRYTNPDGSCDPRCCGVCPALPCNRAATFAPCCIVVGGFAGVGSYARLPGLLDDRTGRNHSTALWSDSNRKLTWGGWNELAATSVGNRRATNHCRPGLGGFLRGRPMYAGGARAVVDHGLAAAAAVPWSGADARPRRDNDSRRRAWT